ncbi:MAG: carbon starvation protein A [Proteobacteria bacterium]|nr:carbon starvation protein A [Pseudomonadota bacterium]
MNTAIILGASVALFALAYRYHSPWISRRLGVQPHRPTPAHTMRDDVDYCPAKAPVLFGHHFASIAGAAPIVGPIVAATYGWLPVLLWIVLGGIFLGSVHDFAALVASVHHRGLSIGEIIGRYVGRFGSRIFLFFLWATLVLLMAVFLVVVSKTFESAPSASTASTLFIGLACAFGLAIYRFRLPLGVATVAGVAVLAACMAAGWAWPLALAERTWISLLIAYIVLAAVLPVWLLLQPRDFLNSFLLYALIAAGAVGVLAAGGVASYPAYVAWFDPKLGALFPILFVTVACGAISGFHSIVASGTTAKQLDRESEARPVGYGAMLLESLLALIALIVVMRMGRADYLDRISAAGPVAIFSDGIGAMLGALGVPQARGAEFAALAVSAFVLTTLDTATRLGRFALQELFAPRKGAAHNIVSGNRYVATILTVAAAGALAYSGKWKMIWPIFGAANQLLAAIALLAVSIWLKRAGGKSAFLRIPMFAMFAITLSALGVIIHKDLSAGNFALASISAALLALAVTLVWESIRSVRRANTNQ